MNFTNRQMAPFVEQHMDDSRSSPSSMIQEDSRGGTFTGAHNLRTDNDSKKLVSVADYDEQQRVGCEDFENEFTQAKERKILKKLDRRVVLFVALLYLLSFLDRSNIGNARIAGLEEDLRLNSNQYEWLLTAFYITYILFEWMALLYGYPLSCLSNTDRRRRFQLIRPHIYLASCVMAWGLLASIQSICTSFTSLLACRALLGISEAAFAGVPFYLSFFFRNDELAARVGMFVAAAPLATAFSSSLAFAITWLGEKTHFWTPWRLLFLVEGFPSIIVAYFVWTSLPDGPNEAKFLTAQEKQVVVSRLQDEKSRHDKMKEKHDQTSRPKVKRREVLDAVLDPKCYITAIMFFSINVAFSSMPVFLPTIIKDMGWSSAMSQALSAPPYLLAFVAIQFTAFASDKLKSRSLFIMLNAALACSGYLLMFFAGLFGLPNVIRYLGVYPAIFGFFTCVTLIITWTSNIQKSNSKKGAAVAMLQYFGQCGPLLGTRLYPKSEGPLYLNGMAICAGFMALVGFLALYLRWMLEKENAKLRRERVVGDGEDDVELLVEGQERKLATPFTLAIQ
jgi:MFS family permease